MVYKTKNNNKRKKLKNIQRKQTKKQISEINDKNTSYRSSGDSSPPKIGKNENIPMRWGFERMKFFVFFVFFVCNREILVKPIHSKRERGTSKNI